MLKSKKCNKRLIYNNYQYYENSALNKLLKKQSEEGYNFYGATGLFLSVLKFCKDKVNNTKNYTIFRRRLDKEVDDNLEVVNSANSENSKIVYHNNLYAIVEDKVNKNEKEVDKLVEKQNKLLSVSLKKAIIFILTLFVTSVLGFVFKGMLFQRGNIYFNYSVMGICLALIVNFSIYFIGDIHDYVLGKGILDDGKIYFSSRTNFKDTLFKIGDIFKFLILVVSISISIGLMVCCKDLIMYINVFKMWFVFCALGFGFKLKYQRSYVTLLLVETFLIIFSVS